MIDRFKFCKRFRLTFREQLKGREYSCDEKDGKGLSGLEACASSLSKTVTGQDILDDFGYVWKRRAHVNNTTESIAVAYRMKPL